jgi:hypothetical protein
MNILFKLAATAVLSSSIVSCGSNATTKPGADSTQTAEHHGEHQAYRCPMNCEKGKTYGKPGKCPVCGMTLEKVEGGENNTLVYQMQFKTDPHQLQAGTPATLFFTPSIAGRENEKVELEVQHEKKIHLIITSDDLSYFEHIHPELQSDGSYKVKVLGNDDAYTNEPERSETRFDLGGNYLLFADYKPAGSIQKVEKIPLSVSGSSRPAMVSYSVTLNPKGGKIVTGGQAHFEGVLKKDGKPIDANSLENYLGEKAHMVVVSVEDKEYLHVHPGVANGKYDLHTTFTKPGVYRGWIQFQAEGKVHTIDFTMNVAQGTGTAHGNHSHH